MVPLSLFTKKRKKRKRKEKERKEKEKKERKGKKRNEKERKDSLCVHPLGEKKLHKCRFGIIALIHPPYFSSEGC